MRPRHWPAALLAVAAMIPASERAAFAVPPGPPWFDADDIPLSAWVHSIEPRRGDLVIFEGPTRASSRRGLSVYGARLPLFAAKRGPGCAARWMQVGPLAWVCSDGGDLSAEDPAGEPMHVGTDGLPYQYFFTGRDGGNAYGRLESAGDVAPDRELEAGWAVAIVEQRVYRGTHWGRTTRGTWIAMRELFPARPSTFHGEEIKDGKGIAFVVPERATVYAAPAIGKATGSRVKRQAVGWYEEKGTGPLAMARISPDGQPAEWMLARDLAHAPPAPPPTEVGPAERWIDVHLGSQTLVAYEGARPVYGTLVSTGRGPRGSDSATPPGVHRIWVKLNTSTMDNVEREDLYKHYSMEDVPYVMFFAKAVALHGAFWHDGFGRVRSHGCVNVAPLDARWLFAFTSPHMPLGWHAAYPTRYERGTVIRVRP